MFHLMKVRVDTHIRPFRFVKSWIDLYMKTTEIVRRIEECVIIGQTVRNPHKHWGFGWFTLLNTRVSKNGFSMVFYT